MQCSSSADESFDPEALTTEAAREAKMQRQAQSRGASSKAKSSRGMTMMTMPERTCRGQAIASSCLSRPSRAETVHQYRKCGLRRTKGEGITGSDVTSFTVPTMWFPLAVQMQCTKATRVWRVQTLTCKT